MEATEMNNTKSFISRPWTFLVVLFALTLSCSRTQSLQIKPLVHAIKYPVIAHSHNDYEQDHPLSTALKYGFRSIEVDIVYDGNLLRVSHDEDHLDTKPEFEELYLSPLSKSSIIPKEGLILLVDLKNYSDALLQTLNDKLNKYKDYLVNRSNPLDLQGKIQIVLSGDYPRNEVIENTTIEFLFIDGRLNENDLHLPSELVPIISIDYSDIPTLQGLYNNKGSHKEKVSKTIEIVHSNEKLIRFWKTKDHKSSWQELIKLGVDIIGIDNIQLFYSEMYKQD